MISIVDATIERISERGFTTIGLLGTKYTMESDLFKAPAKRRGIEVITPSKQHSRNVQEIIYNELVRGVVRPESMLVFDSAVEELGKAGVEAVVLACTELQLLVDPKRSRVPRLDTVAIHAEQALECATGGVSPPSR